MPTGAASPLPTAVASPPTAPLPSVGEGTALTSAAFFERRVLPDFFVAAAVVLFMMCALDEIRRVVFV